MINKNSELLVLLNEAKTLLLNEQKRILKKMELISEQAKKENEQSMGKSKH